MRALWSQPENRTFLPSGFDLFKNGHFKNVQNRFGSAGLEKLFACHAFYNLREIVEFNVFYIF